MELFRVGGDVPDTNYLFMGPSPILARPTRPSATPETNRRPLLKQATSSTEASTP